MCFISAWPELVKCFNHRHYKQKTHLQKISQKLNENQNAVKLFTWFVVYRQLSNFSAISWWEQVNFQWVDEKISFVLDQQWTRLDFFIVLAYWKDSLLMDMSPHSDTLSRFQSNQSLLFLLNAGCLAEKQQIRNL